MAKEIERKFLVDSSDAHWRSAQPVVMKQGYLNLDSERTVRVRVRGEQAFLTVKGLTTGMSREEFEYEVPVEDGDAMLRLCHHPLIEKTRYEFEFKGNVWEIDEFHGVNEGLVVAEIELTDEAQTFDAPDWIREEVTDDPRYFNSSLAQNPLGSSQEANS